MIDTTMHFAELRLSDESFANPRTKSGLDDASIRELALDIGQHGLLVPLIVTPKGTIIAGQRRYRAIEWLIAGWGFAASREANELSLEELALVRGMTTILTSKIPVRIFGGAQADIEGVALADNLQRSDLSGYEVAARLADLHAKGATGRELARMTGKSASWVSRKLTAYNGAGAELKSAWELGEVAEDTVIELASLTHTEQAKVLAGPVPRGRRGAANRPSIEQIKDVLFNMESAGYQTNNPHMEVGVARYAAGVVDVLRWVSGHDASKALADLINKSGGG